MRNRATLELSESQKQALSGFENGPNRRLARRASIVLLTYRGVPAQHVSERLSVTLATVYKWRRRFAAQGIEGLADRPRPGQPRRLSTGARSEVARVTVEEVSANGGRWSVRSLAIHLGLTPHQVRSVWAEAGLRPHKREASSSAASVLGGAPSFRV